MAQYVKSSTSESKKGRSYHLSKIMCNIVTPGSILDQTPNNKTRSKPKPKKSFLNFFSRSISVRPDGDFDRIGGKSKKNWMRRKKHLQYI